MHLFHRPGTAYIYVNYGIHWMLVRAAKPVAGFPEGIPRAKFSPRARTCPHRIGVKIRVTESSPSTYDSP